MNPANEKTYEFLEKYLKDLSKLFDSDFWHLGGDEVSIGCVNGLRSTQEFLRNHNVSLNDLQDYYVERERKILTDIDSKKVAGYWYRGENQKYGKGDILQYWGGSGGLDAHLARYPDNYFIFSPSDRYYLDCGYINQYAGGSWCGGIHTWKDIWSLDPLNLVSEAHRERFLGAELPLWSEMNNEFNLPLKLFPRGAALSFRYWNPKSPSSNAKVIENLVKHQYRLIAYDIPSSRVTQRYCENHLHHCFGK